MSDGRLRHRHNTSVVICCHANERFHDICEAITSVHHQMHTDDEIVVVVDHNPSLRRRLELAAPTAVRLVANRHARGLSGARNTGVAETVGAYVVFLDDDAVASPGMIDAMRTNLDENANVLGVVARIDPIWIGTERPCWFPSEFLWVVGCSYVGVAPGPVRNLIGAAMALRREVFETVGGFVIGVGRGEGDLPLGCEETELCMRAARAFPDATFVMSASADCGHKVPAARASWAYFAKRCVAEGISKARIASLSADANSLHVERNYVARTLSKAVATSLIDLVRGRDVCGAAKAFAILLGLATATIGYGLGLCQTIFAHARPLDAATKLWARGSAIVGKGFSVNAPMLSKGLIYAASNVAGAILGFFFWWFAAHNLAPKAVGSAAATISLINLLGQAGEAGLGALLIGRIPHMTSRAPTLIVTAMAAAAAACCALAVLTLAIQHAVGVSLTTGNMFGFVFVLAVAITGVTQVLDQTLIGLLRPGTQMWRNMLFNISKLALLATAAYAWGRSAGAGAIIGAWVIGSLVPLGHLAARSISKGKPDLPRPDLRIMRPFLAEVLGHHCLNVAVLIPYFALPLVVTAILSPTANAAFYALWSILNAVLLVPAAFTTVLYSVGAADPVRLKARLEFSLTISATLCLAVAFALLVCSQDILGVFNRTYPSIAGDSLRLLGFGTLGVMLKFHYVTIQRLVGRTFRSAVLLAGGAAIELAMAAWGGHLGGLKGVAVGWLIAQAFEAAFMLPSLFLPSRKLILDAKLVSFNEAAIS